MSAERRVRLKPDPQGNYRCPACDSICSLRYLLFDHADAHHCRAFGNQRAEITFEITAVIRGQRTNGAAP